MSRRLFALPVLALAASLAPSRPNAEEVGLHQIVLRQLGLAWRRCIEESFAAQGRLTDRPSAAELAFQSCRTQERAFVAGAMSHPRMRADILSATIESTKAKWKSELVNGDFRAGMN